MIKSNKQGFSLIELIIAIGIIFILASMSRPTIHNYRLTKAQEECFSNLKTLNYAIARNNIENTKDISTSLPGLDYEKCEEILIEANFLKEPLKPTYEGCSYGYIEKDKNNQTFCKIHGTIESDRHKTIMPEYDKSLEKPFSPAYNSLRKK